jgi:hypothetical protein
MTAGMTRGKMCQEPTPDKLRLASFRLMEVGSDEFVASDVLVRGSGGPDPVRPGSLRTRLANFLSLDPTLAGDVGEAAFFNHPEEGGLNVEALAWVPREATPPNIEQQLRSLGNDGTLLFGLRGPLSKTPGPRTPDGRLPAILCVEGRDAGSGSALYMYMLNPDQYLRGEQSPLLRGPLQNNVTGRVDLGNRGFRDATFITVPGLGPRLLIIAGSVDPDPDNTGAVQENPAAFLFNTRQPAECDSMNRCSFPEGALIEISLPPNSAGKAIEAAVALMVEGVESLAFYTDNGDKVKSEVAVIRTFSELPLP